MSKTEYIDPFTYGLVALFNMLLKLSSNLVTTFQIFTHKCSVFVSIMTVCPLPKMPALGQRKNELLPASGICFSPVTYVNRWLKPGSVKKTRGLGCLSTEVRQIEEDFFTLWTQWLTSKGWMFDIPAVGQASQSYFNDVILMYIGSHYWYNQYWGYVYTIQLWCWDMTYLLHTS